MSPRWLALVALACSALAAAPARAAIPLALYPFRVPGLAPAQRADLHSVLEAAIASAARRGVLQPRSPLRLSTICGEAPAATCLAAAAGEGVVLAGRGELKGGVVLVTAALHDRTGARTREVRFVVDLVIQNLRPVGDAIAELEIEIEPDGTVAAGASAPAARDPEAPRSGIAAAPPPAPPSAPAARPAARVDVSPPAPRPALWKRQAGPLFTFVGAGLLAGGAVVGYLDRSLADELEAKRAAGTLSPADRSSYDRVDRYNVLSTVLFAAGGVSAAAGTWFWITAPARPGAPAVAGAGGRF